MKKIPLQAFSRITRSIVLAGLAVLLSSSLPAAVENVEPLADGAVFTLGSGRLQVRFITDSIARIQSTRNASWSSKPSLMCIAAAATCGKIELLQNDRFVALKSSALCLRIDRRSEGVSYLAPDGTEILCEAPVPRAFERVKVVKSVADPTTITKVETVDGERMVAGRYIQAVDREAWKGQLNFRFADDEALYGLGFDETADLNLRGKTKRLYQHNLRILIPSLISTRGYGLLFDAYSAMTFADDAQGGSLSFDVIDDLDYYFIYGPSMDQAIAGNRQLTGAAAMLPRWAYGYVQSKERYKTQDEVVATVKKFRDRKIPLDVIVQDWSYWTQWGGDVDAKRYPDIARMVRDIHDQNARVMISIWPNPSEKSTSGKAIQSAGYTLAGTPFIDFSDARACALYWDLAAWKPFGQYGMDSWWCDSTEPENADWVKIRPADHDAVNIAGLAKIIDPQYLNAYGLWDAKGIFENQRKAVPERRVLNLTRSSYAGGQRFGAVLWTGDISATWATLAQQVAAVQSISAAGYPYITTDVGGFCVSRRPYWFWRGDFDKGVADLGYREIYARWLQFATFLPMFRSHGTDTPREPWNFGEPGTPFYDAIIDTIDLRYRLLPHLYSLSGLVCKQNASWLRPVAFSFPGDAKTHDLKTQFMVGDELMVAPVISPRLYGPGSAPIADGEKTVDVYLPEKSTWIDFWNGQTHTGGRTIRADAPISHTPLLVKAGSILPLGSRVQYAGEKNSAALELRIYPGADGSYDFYEDAGEGWDYQTGACSMIPFSWDDHARILTIGAIQGGFPGMLRERHFNVVLVTPRTGTGLEPAAKPMSLSYTGQQVTASVHE